MWQFNLCNLRNLWFQYFGCGYAALGHFAPKSRAYTSVTADIANQDYNFSVRGPTGTVLSYQKISAAEGGFTGPVGPLYGNFGSSAVSIGDLDGNGTVDLAVGFYGANDGGTDRGAVRIIFLNADGTVKSAHTISDTKGNFAGSLSNRDYFGSSVSSLGDLDGDGGPDLIVGSIGDAVEGVLVTADNGYQTDVTDASGYYELVLYVGWSGTITPSKSDRTFTPSSR